jgi:hypothetical protein
MPITINLPAELESHLRADSPNLDRETLESLSVQWYRQRRINHRQLAQLLGLSRYDLDGVLKRHGVTEDLLTPQELARQLENP